MSASGVGLVATVALACYDGHMTAFNNPIGIRRRFHRVFVFGGVLLMFAACGGTPPSVSSSTDTLVNTDSPASTTDAPASPNTPASTAPRAQGESPPTPQKVSMDGSSFRNAALEGQLETVQQAIEAGVDVNSLDEGRRTALLMAAFNGHTRIVKLLLDNGASVEHRDLAGRTALLYASTGANDETVRVLLEAGAEPNVTDKGEGFTPLMHAAAEGQAKVVQTLLKHNADPTLRDVDGDTALDFATQNGHDNVVRLLSK